MQTYQCDCFNCKGENVALTAGKKLTAFVNKTVAATPGIGILAIIQAIMAAISNPQVMAFLQMILSLFVTTPMPVPSKAKLAVATSLPVHAAACCPCKGIDQLLAWLETWFGAIGTYIQKELDLIEANLP
jgi:hypothetical protein